MKRGEFINSMGKGVLLVCAGSCLLSGCSSGDDGTPASNPSPGNGGDSSKVSVELSSLSAVGDQVRKNGVLFFRIGEGNATSDFVATEAICPHQGGQLVWEQDNGYVECQLHFARYEPDGDIIRGPQDASGSTRDLKVYPTSISGGTLTANIG
ncbi:ubiquinol-cytochrome c reductase iron-sulfur subunit [Christiangramia salexigens]|uniref:Rieske n=1 Tax=Christiangramia salexigens TaxID=1913577 RepID=A0A1L3J5U4_9FLAO|nr:Rieske (2Fe-2S) protein [Christiangramia salexigens]APG60491.1 Rieske [Christiangramia salexigens]